MHNIGEQTLEVMVLRHVSVKYTQYCLVKSNLRPTNAYVILKL